MPEEMWGLTSLTTVILPPCYPRFLPFPPSWALRLGEGVASVILAASRGARRANFSGKWPGHGAPLSGSQSWIQEKRGATRLL